MLRSRNCCFVQYIVICICLLCLYSTTRASTADTLQHEASQSQKRELQQKLIEQLQTTTQPQQISTEPHKESTSQENQHCSQIHKIAITGNLIIPTSAFQDIQNKYKATCLTIKNIQSILSEITNIYLEQGFITSRAGLPLPQYRLQLGELHLSVAEGHIEAIDITPTQNGDNTYELLFSDLTNQVLNMRTLEMRLAQMNRLASQQVTLDIQPGTQPNKSIVRIATEEKETQFLTLTIDNSGSKSTGVMKRTLEFSHDNIMKSQDNITLNFNESYNQERALRLSESWNFIVSAPIQNNLYTYNHTRSKYLTHQILASNDILYTFGNTMTHTYSLERKLFQNNKNMGQLTTTLARKKEESFTRIRDVVSQSTIGSRTLTTLDIGYKHTRFFQNGGMLFLQTSIKKGLPWFSALHDKTSGLTTKAQFDMLKLFGYWQQNISITGSPSWNVTWNAQLSEEELFGSEQLGIGGSDSVRGFKKYSLSGKSGYNIQNSLSFFLPAQGINTTVTPFLDFGEVYTGTDIYSLAGIGLKLRFQHKHFDANLTYAKSVKTPIQIPQEKGVFYFSMKFLF